MNSARLFCSQNHYRLGVKCAKCPDMAWIFILLFIVAMVLCMLLGVWLNNRRINLAALGIGVDFAQVWSWLPGLISCRLLTVVCRFSQIVAMFVSFSFLWPSELKTLFTSISFFSFNIQIVAPEVSP